MFLIQHLIESYSCAGHGMEDNCSNSCEKISLERYMEDNEDISRPKVSTYIHSVDSKINALISSFFKSPAFELNSDDYNFQVLFDAKGQVFLNGLIWPKFLQDFNLALCEAKSTNINDIKNNCLKMIKKSISTTSNINNLKKQFDMSEEEANLISRLALTYQGHICLSCQDCKSISLPSLEWGFTVAAENIENFYTAQRFLFLMKDLLLECCEEYVMVTSTQQWLEDVWDEFNESFVVSPGLWKLSCRGQEFYFQLETRLAVLVEEYPQCPCMAAYQFSIFCVERGSEPTIVLQRLDLLDCFIRPYSPSILKTTESSMNIQINNSKYNWLLQDEEAPNYQSCLDLGLTSHRQISLTEALSLTDSKKLKTRSSSPIEFVNTSHKASGLFKKVQTWNENCFKVRGEDSFYELQQNFITRYFNRMNFQKILLCEFVCWYDYSGKSKSESLYEIYQNKLDKIESSTFKCATGDEALPSLIVCCNGDIMVLRKSPKILRYPTFDEESYDFKYSQLLLFSFINSLDNLTEQTVDTLYSEINEDGEQVIVTNKR